MSNPVMALYNALNITVPADVDALPSPLLSKIDYRVGTDKEFSLGISRLALNAIFNRAAAIVKRQYPNVDTEPLFNVLPHQETAPHDGFNLFAAPDKTGKQVIFATVAGATLARMNDNQKQDMERAIYAELGRLFLPFLPKQAAAAAPSMTVDPA